MHSSTFKLDPLRKQAASYSSERAIRSSCFRFFNDWIYHECKQVELYNTSNNNPDGWFYDLDEGKPMVIDTGKDGTDSDKQNAGEKHLHFYLVIDHQLHSKDDNVSQITGLCFNKSDCIEN